MMKKRVASKPRMNAIEVAVAALADCNRALIEQATERDRLFRRLADVLVTPMEEQVKRIDIENQATKAAIAIEQASARLNPPAPRNQVSRFTDRDPVSGGALNGQHTEDE